MRSYHFKGFYHAFNERQQNASRVLAMVWASVCLSVCYTAVLYQNGASLDHEIYTVAASKTLGL